MVDDRESVDLVLEGGGVKGIALLGAVLTLAEAGYRFERIAGTSAGAIVAALVAAYQKDGRDLHEFVDVMQDLDYRRFADEPWLERITGPVGEVVATIIHGGSHTGDYLTEWLAPLLENAGVRTFADLRISDHRGSLLDYQKYSLVVQSGRPVPGDDRPVRTASGIAINCLRTLTSDWNRYRLDGEGVNNRTMYVDTMNISATDFDISRDDQLALFTNGQLAARQFLDKQTAQLDIAG